METVIELILQKIVMMESKMIIKVVYQIVQALLMDGFVEEGQLMDPMVVNLFVEIQRLSLQKVVMMVSMMILVVLWVVQDLTQNMFVRLEIL